MAIILKKQGVISFGEVIIDYISENRSNTKFTQLLGGATVNVIVVTRRLGLPSYYLCRLGVDESSLFVEKEFAREKINTEYCDRTPSKKICGVYVHLNEKGERTFHSYVNPTPDEWLLESELKQELFEKAKIFYFGSGTLFHGTAKKTTLNALQYANEFGLFRAFDTNIRLKRWESEEQCRRTILSILPHVDLVKMAEEELCFLTETTSLDDGLQKLSELKIPFLFVTRGSEGTCAVMKGDKIFVPAVKVKAIDTTGAGDAFMAALLLGFHEKGKPENLSQLEKYAQFANKIASLSTTEIGALTALKDLQEEAKRFNGN
ncbi:carbohydrate kinase [Bacillus xiapuensis]|uniref:Carbohydrate kinase n=1 Tax=Bacillus xiapuensis TaxID=2014075 RepID=A0ABU6N8V4_9BACI|nr:carbohydrate kinase [Bacillus xiapuensis]